MTTNDADANATVRKFYDALNTGDLSVIDAALTPDWVAVPPLRTGPGSAGWKASISHLRNVFAGLTVTIQDVIVSGDRAAVRSICRGTHNGELLGLPPTGREVEFSSCDIHQLKDGRIVQTWHLEDYFGIAKQLGLTFS